MSTISEFALIEQFFANCGMPRADCVLSVGDDAAVLAPPAGVNLVVTQDTLVAGIHFFADVAPAALGHKTLAVNLSDLAAMGADPAWCTLSLTIPEADPHWLSEFARGFDKLARAIGVQLVGGDTTRGPLALSVTAIGLSPAGQALRRSGAKPGDLIYVSGTIGDAGLALGCLLQNKPVTAELLARLEQPTPRIALGKSLRGLASAAIDISDGLIADLTHILTCSNVGADVRSADIPKSSAAHTYLEQTGDPTSLLTAGDDYELCFTVAPDKVSVLETRKSLFACPITCIGTITLESGLRLYAPNGQILPITQIGYTHFS